MTTAAPTTSESVLRTMSPALRSLEKGLRLWLDAEHRYPVSTLTRAALEGLANDLQRQADALEQDKPLLVIMLMGGTGVGKSTLLNALAGGAIAQASFARPTTRDPVVYFHESVQTHRLDPALQHCRLAQHDRHGLEQKILVDTPDLDSNDLANREKLHSLLPVADVVLYVGSQEKYHDRLGWELFLEHRRRRAFAFVLNKWDRCVQKGALGLRPDEDLINDLKGEGFENPLVFRTCAQHWVDAAAGQNTSDAIDGEQFLELTEWLEMGLTRLEVESIKARGVSQLLEHLRTSLEDACPPDLTEVAEKTRATWDKLLLDEAISTAQVLLDTLEPFQREVEHHFAAERQRHFRGIMGAYLGGFNRLKYAGSQLRDRVSIGPRSLITATQQTALDLGEFTRACSAAASDRHLDARGKALANRLLLDADKIGFPLNLLTQPTESAAKIDWRQRYSQALIDVLSKVEQAWARPTGIRRYLQGTVILLSDWLPGIGFVAALVWLLWTLFFPSETGYKPHLVDWLLPVLVTFSICLLLHIFVALLLPLRWQAIREEFQKHLATTMQKELGSVYGTIPLTVAEQLLAERRLVEQLLGDTREVESWLEKREQAATITGLYGKQKIVARSP
jgi:energy-coupling factor transporter ATP-binding protein EcfA2